MVLKWDVTNCIHLDPDLFAEEGHSPTDVIEEHHCCNCFPRAPNPQELCGIHQVLPASFPQKRSSSPIDVLKPDPDVTKRASIPAGELSSQPTKLRSYPFKFSEIIEQAKQLAQCGAAVDPFPNRAWFIDEKSAEYIAEAIAERMEKGIFIPPGESYNFYPR